MARRSDTTKRPRPLAEVVPLMRKRPPRKATKPKAQKPLSPEEIEEAVTKMALRLGEAAEAAQARREQLSIVFDLCEPKAAFIADFHPSRNKLNVAVVRGRSDARVSAGTDEDAADHAFRTGKVVRGEDGSIAAPLIGPNGRVGVLGLVDPRRVVSDQLLRLLAAQLGAATEVARLRDEAARRNKDLQTAIAGLKSLERSREEMLFSISHELKTPLTTIKAYLAMIAREKLGPVNAEQLGAVSTCDRNADRLLRMINDLLLLARLQSGQMQLSDRPFGLKSLVEGTLASLEGMAEHAKVHLSLASCPEIYVQGDRERLGEALYNLVDQAIYQSPANAQVRVNIEPDPSGFVVLSITDQGPGLSQQQLDDLLESFYRFRPNAKPRLTDMSLGLPIAARIIQLHGGRITAHSRPGEGTTFRLSLPQFAGAVAQQPDEAAPRSGGILLVEDDADCREVLTQLLEQEGYRVISAASCAEAKAVLGHIRPALILLDLRLSDDDGRAVLHSVRGSESLADTPVYLISGATDVTSFAGAKGLDRIDGYFEKPLVLPKVLDAVAQVVRPARAPASLA